jgi:hypothetical protein
MNRYYYKKDKTPVLDIVSKYIGYTILVLILILVIFHFLT